MNSTDIPYKFLSAWASAADPSYITAAIPPTAASPAASQELGFPPATGTPVGAGGSPPNINDFNGFGLYVTSWLLWLQAGGRLSYDGAFSAAVGGYPSGAVLVSSVNTGQYWLSTADNNTTDPDGGSPANWVSLFYGPSFAATNDVTMSRSLGVTYTNTTNRPMQVSVEGITTVSGQNLLLFSGTICIAQIGQAVMGATCFVTGIIPAGSTYHVDTSTAGFTIQTWAETY